MKKIPVSNGEAFALVDDEDYDRLIKYPWYISRTIKYKRAITCLCFYENGKARKFSSPMHRFVMNTPRGMETDHINGDTLDNRKSNLRVCTKSQNMANRKVAGVSKYLGVCWHKATKKWTAAIRKNNKSYNLGIFENEKDAALAYDKMARELHGEFARPNFPVQP